MIAKELEAEIVRLYHGERWPIGTLARQVGVHHTTVQRALRHTGVDVKVVAPRPSRIAPFLPFIAEQLEKYPKLRASRLYGMVKERGYTGGARNAYSRVLHGAPAAPPPPLLEELD